MTPININYPSSPGIPSSEISANSCCCAALLNLNFHFVERICMSRFNWQNSYMIDASVTKCRGSWVEVVGVGPGCGCG